MNRNSMLSALVLALGFQGSAWAQDDKGDDVPDEKPDSPRILPKRPGQVPARPDGQPGQGQEDDGSGGPGAGGRGGPGGAGGGADGPPGGVPPGGVPPGGVPPGGVPPGGAPGGDAKGLPPNGASSAAGGVGSVNSKRVPCVEPKSKVTMDFAEAPLADVIKYMAEITCRNFILGDDIKGQVTIISHQQVTVPEAYEAFLSALEVAGYTTVTVGKSTKVVATFKAANAPLRVYEGDEIPGTDNFVTQIIQLDNVSVTDISTIVKELSGASARVIAYAPTNTLMVTDAAYNIRRVYRIIMQLDVAAPKSHIEVIPLRFATAADVERILEDVYGVAATSTSTTAPAPTTAVARAAARRGRTAEAAAPASASSTTVGTEGAFISKIISDERTNSLIVLANDEAIAKVRELVARIDIDIDPASRSQIHVIYLEHAQAEDVSSVLSSLSGGSSGGRSGTTTGGTSRSSRSRSTTGGGGPSGNFGGQGGAGRPGGAGGGGPKPEDAPELPGGADGAAGTSGVAQAFDSNVRIAADENTNSLVVIAPPEDYRILKGVIDRLDIPRRQVFVQVVVLEVGSDEEFNVGLGLHLGEPTASGGIQFGSAQLNGSSYGPNAADLLSGLAAGVFGPSIPVTVSDGQGGTKELTIPAFGIALHALASNSAVNILSNPEILVMDNEEATITVGRNVPFPVSAGRDNNGQAIVSFQREDVGITLQVTPQINESNYVTLELSLEVAEVEGDTSSVSLESAGFITSKRETENVVVVQDNQTIVIGGLIGNTKSDIETKVPILGDLPLFGALFRGRVKEERKTNLLIFLTPHVINEPADLEEIYRIKWAQREEFMRRFYGESREKQEKELHSLLYGSMNFVDEPTPWRTKPLPTLNRDEESDGSPTAPAAPDEFEELDKELEGEGE